jgi:hypothetical protein
MTLTDENAFGVLIGYHAIEDDEYEREPSEFAARFREFRDAVRECVSAFPLAESALVRELGHAVYLEFADGDQKEDPIGWIKLVRARLNAHEFASVGVLSHGGRWLAEEPEPSAPSVPGIAWQAASLPSEPLRRALYAETATHGNGDREDDDADASDTDDGWGPGIYVDTEAVAALGRTLKNAPTPLAVAGATFYRVAR